ncbi:MAG: hypothetical protein ACSHX5_11030 [Phycisphaerales bacterium]
MHRLISICILLISSPLLAQTTPTFTYQGHFLDEGLPAQGNYDIVIRIHDQETDGTLLASSQILDAEIVDGLFTINIPTEAPPGTPLFSADDRWIEIGFRDGDKSIFDPYTFLPRQLARYTPLAAHATRAEHAQVADELSDPIWSRFGFAQNVTAGSTNTNFYLNSDQGLGNATLLVNRDTNGQNGIAITTTGADGHPYLSFSSGFGGGANFGLNSSLLFEGDTGIFNFRNNAGTTTARLVPNTGLEILDGGVFAADFEYTAPETRRLNISSAAWIPTTNVDYKLASVDNGLRSYISQSGFFSQIMVAPVSLPDGAVIQNVKFYYGLDFNTELTLSLIRGTNTGTSLSLVASVLDLTQATPSPITLNADPASSIVDNGIFTYYLQAISDDWDNNPRVSLGPVIITYTVSEPD